VNARPHYRRNFTALVIDFAGFGLGFAFYSPSTILPAFVSELTASAPLIGLVSTLLTGAWLLPQLVAANYLAGRERQKPYLIASAVIGRSLFFPLAGVVYFLGGIRPVLTLIVFYLCLTAFMVCDAMTSVAWFDMWAKMIPPTRRGRVVGIGQVLSGLMTIGAAEIVSHVLSPTGPVFPTNYALLFLLAGGGMMISLFAMLGLREPPGEATRERTTWREFLPQLGHVLREDVDFRVLTIVRWLAGLGGLASPFYIVYATSELGMPAQTIGLFISAQTAGSITAGFLLGYLNERWGSRMVIQLSRLLALIQPLLALAFVGLPIILGKDAAGSYITPLAYAPIFLLLGIVNGAMMPGFVSYIVDLAPEGSRPLYAGLANTLSGAVMIVPLLGGWLLDATSYPVLFIATAVGSALSLLFALRLSPVRESAA
jgi:MFS family permease